MTGRNDPRGFARAWAAAWNRRDLEAVLAHFSHDAVFTSPLAREIGFVEDGVVRGKQALRRYWTAALERNPDLHFELTGVYDGVDTVVIGFRTQDGLERAEVLTFDGGLVVRGHGTFSAGEL